MKFIEVYEAYVADSEQKKSYGLLNINEISRIYPHWSDPMITRIYTHNAGDFYCDEPYEYFKNFLLNNDNTNTLRISC